ncbi:MAG TPA: site-specific integrase [Nitrososphaeraceae archaeon]|nr:site-specific integrase [Nitrososphaeraceae archaeon]
MQRQRTVVLLDSKYVKVAEFLNRKGSNSVQTKRVYGFALSHFQTFLPTEFKNKYDIETILVPLQKRQVDVYGLLDKFVAYLRRRQDRFNSNTKLSEKSIWLYVAGVRSYFQYFDVDISSAKFRNRVRMPKKHKRRKEPLNAKKIRSILLSCTNIRLRTFLLIIASSGMRANEALSLRNSDVDFSQLPTKVHIMAENTKTKQERDIYISDEATNDLKQFVVSKYSNMEVFGKYPNHLLFSKLKSREVDPPEIYRTLHREFTRVLKKVEMDRRKDGQGIQRRKITFHTFRDFVKSQVAVATNRDFSEWILGHSVSTYWNVDEEQTKDLYQKCMKYLTFLDYPTVESVGADFESKLQERDNEIEQLKIGMEELKKLYMKAMSGHMVMEGDWDEKQGKFIQGKHRERLKN